MDLTATVPGPGEMQAALQSEVRIEGKIMVGQGTKGEKGEPGNIGPQGKPGPQGETGPQGEDGLPGISTEWLSGTSAPQTKDGVFGDWYMNTTNSSYYYKDEAASGWVLKGSLKGNDGSLIYAEAAEPSNNIGNNRDLFINTLTGDYYIKNNGVWNLVANLKADVTKINQTLGFFNDVQKPHAPYNFEVIEGVRSGVPFTEFWMLINARYDRETQRFKRIDPKNFSFGWQFQGGGTYPGEESIGDYVNQGCNLWKANGKNAYPGDDEYSQYLRDLTGEDIGQEQPDGSWREYGIMLGWNNHFMNDSYGGMTIGGAGFEIDGSGTSPFCRVSLGKFSGGSREENRPITEYQYAYNGRCWNTQHGLWNKDEDQLDGYYLGMESPIDFYDQGENLNIYSNRALMSKCKFVFKRLGGYVRPYVENWQNVFEVDEEGNFRLNNWEKLEEKVLNITQSETNPTLIVNFPDASWNKDNMFFFDLVGTYTANDGTKSTKMLRDKEQKWTTTGATINIGTGYTSVKVGIRKIKKNYLSLSVKNGLTINDKPVVQEKMIEQIFTTNGDINFSYPDATWNKNNTMITEIIGLLKDGNRRHINVNVAMSDYGFYGYVGSIDEYVGVRVFIKKY